MPISHSDKVTLRIAYFVGSHLLRNLPPRIRNLISSWVDPYPPSDKAFELFWRTISRLPADYLEDVSLATMQYWGYLVMTVLFAPVGRPRSITTDETILRKVRNKVEAGNDIPEEVDIFLKSWSRVAGRTRFFTMKGTWAPV